MEGAHHTTTWQTSTSLVTLVRMFLALQYKYLLRRILFTLDYITKLANIVLINLYLFLFGTSVLGIGHIFKR